MPTTPAEQVESTHQAFEAGASLTHIHVRNDEESATSDPERFARVHANRAQILPRHDRAVLDRRARCGRRRAAGFAAQDRHGLALTGSVKFPASVYENSAGARRGLAIKMRTMGVKPEIEVFDLSHIHGARWLVDGRPEGEPPYVQFVMGVKNAMPAEERLLDILLDETRRVLPKATWTAAGIGVNQSARDGMGARAHGADGACAHPAWRTISAVRAEDRLARSNAELVEVAVALMAGHDARPATCAEARAMLGIGPG